MRICLLLLFILHFGHAVVAQTVTTDPAIPRPDQPVTITVDVTGTSLDNFAWDNATNPVWIWTWIADGCSSSCDAPTNVNPATDAQDAAKMTRISTDPDRYQITFTPTTFFNRPASELKKIGVKLKTRDWSEEIQTNNNRFIDLFTGFVVSFSVPTQTWIFKSDGEELSMVANASEASSLTLKINDVIVANETDATTLTYIHTISGETGIITVNVEADNGTETVSDSFEYIMRTPTVSASRPAGVVDGINYSADDTKVTLSLLAPGKTSVYVLGEFNDWEIIPAYQMKQDGEHFWLEISGLTPGQEYAFQYLVDEELKIADPYADKILDPDDQFIPESSYPDVKAFPSDALSEQWYFNRLSVLQTGQAPYEWVVDDFEKPAKEKLVIYELLIRDFFEIGEANYQNLIDTLSYFKKLGINAIELMPITEYNGNESWGYNPTFMFASDKFYGTKNKLKEFIDQCHQNGIAVILDMVMNHQDMPNAYVMMDFDFASMKPRASNKWFNTDAKHPFNVFFDMNHESEYTKKYLDTINHYWLNEYKFDGFRFDLSKGFTQKNNPDNVGAWSDYDASRIALLKRMADRIWEHTPDAYVILEHLSVNSEEKELAEYRADEGKGMMLWGKMTEPYNENTMGYESGSDISGVYHSSRDWSIPHLISYMESHDEERLMVNNILHGKNVSGHNTKKVETALKRMEAAATIFYTVPGPKMLWQFGELGYDYSINYCSDGTINNECRVGAKPVRWDYREDEKRYDLYEHIADLNRLRATYSIFTSGEASFPSGNELLKVMTLKNNPYTESPVSADQMNALVIVNFDVTAREVEVPFFHGGMWYDYYNGGIDVASGTKVLLKPGAYKLYTDYQVDSPFPLITDILKLTDPVISIYPNPAGAYLKIESIYEVGTVSLMSTNGTRVQLEKLGDVWDIQRVQSGFFIVEVRTASGVWRSKMIKR